LELQSKAKIQ